MTSPHDQLRADVAAEAADQANDAQIAALQQQAATLWGVNASSAAQKVKNDPLFAPQVYRYYQQPGEPIAWPMEYQLGPGQTFVYSDKVSPQQKAAGKADAALLALFRKAPTDRPFYYCPLHVTSQGCR